MAKTTFQRPVNHFSTTLASGHTSGDGQLVLQSGDGTLLGALGTNEKYRITAVTSPGLTETVNKIFEATGLSTNTLTGVTAVEGYSDGNLSAGQVVQVRATAKTFSDIQTAINSLEVITEVSITGAITLDSTAFGKWHICSGTSADYTIGLPACSGHAGEIIGFRMASGLTKLVTLDGSASESIDGALARIMWAKEKALLYCDGSNWFKISGPPVQMACTMRLTANQTGVASLTITKINLDAADLDNTGIMADTTNKRIIIKRTGNYSVLGNALFNALTANSPRCRCEVHKNGSQIFGGEASALLQGYPGIPALSTFESLNAGDYLEVKGLHFTGSTEAFFGAASGDACFLKVVEVLTW